MPKPKVDWAQQRSAQAESGLHRAIADYNLALLNYSFTSAGLLSRHNISLTEGGWSEGSHASAAGKSVTTPGLSSHQTDVRPVSHGGFNQKAASTGTELAF